MPFDRKAFVKPIAHRGFHDAKSGALENTAPAFEQGLAKGYGVECDLQPASDGTPFVFHDFTLERLVAASGPIAARSPADLKSLSYKSRDQHIISFAEFLELANGRGPLLVEIKSNWKTPNADFLKNIAKQVKRYKGPLALMSFDPRVMTAFVELAPKVPRGIVSGVYSGPDWHEDELGKDKCVALTDLLLSGPVKPSFFAYHVKALPRAVTSYIRDVQGLPLFTWTVRSAADRKVASKHADAPIFEGFAA
ncbi:MAG: glycerophosphodiester phosphodiesterase family protein [Hyphomicrobiaceae bacterium]|nr:glycerophosphodiester phosphodiesterase [Hyphomicrobiaceae bacterium]